MLKGVNVLFFYLEQVMKNDEITTYYYPLLVYG